MRGTIDLRPNDIHGEEARFQFALHATVTAEDTLFPALLVNLSRLGLRLKTERFLKEGVIIRVAIAQWPQMRASVVWLKGGYLGAEFEVPLRLEVLSKMVRQSGGLDRLDGMIYI